MSLPIQARSASGTPTPLARIAGRARDSAVPDTAAIVAALGCWALALTGAHASRVSGFGLLASLPVTFYVGLALLTIGFASAVSRSRARPVVLAAYVAALAVMLHATTAILYPEPRYTWTYKHVGVIDYVLTHGHVDRSIDIYQNWPAFFAFNAWLSKVAGISPLSYAAWAELFFALASVSAVVFALRGLSRDPGLVWGAAWLFLIANWIGQDYLAPQAFGFLLVTVLIGLVIRCAPRRAPPRTRIGWAILRSTTRVASRALRGRTPKPLQAAAQPITPGVALVLGAACYLAVVVSHQLSPAMAIAGVAALALVRRQPPIWILAGMVAVEVWWLERGYDFVSRHFNLLQFEPSASVRGPTSGLQGIALGANLSRAAIALILLLAFAGVIRRARGGYWDSTAIVLAVAPAVVMLAQSYGGEGPLRAYLFALPWLCWLAAAACRPIARAATVPGRAWRLIAATAIVGACSLFGYFGQEPLNYVTGDDVAASRWYLDHASATASLTYLAPSFPERVSAGYVKHLDEPRNLLEMPGFRADLAGASRCGAACDATVARDVETFLRADPAPARFVVASPTQDRYLRYRAVGSPAAYGRFVASLRASARFQLAYRHGRAYVFKLIP